MLLAAALAGCGAGARPPARSQVASPPARRTVTGVRSATRPAARRPPPRRRRRPVDPGRLPQTHQLPSARTPAFAAGLRALWTAVRTGQPGRARTAFFPETAYAQVKAIGDAAADWRYRLYADYGLDIAAAHALLAGGGGTARLIGARVPAAYAHWVDPGACENRIGYYEVPNARVVYRQAGTVRSFGIASMISWRGRWYVIHLGYVGKVSIGGRVDAPSAGPGVSTPDEIC